MSEARLPIPPEVASAQRIAADPTLSAWVAANAGSGKTYVLARRIVRLMLAGAKPGSILALTFTKAAAANMANRVIDLLATWATLPDAALDAELLALDGRPSDERRRASARRLFAEALETPGGLKVQTIHAFCERVLHQFPFEANVAAEFGVLDERQAADMRARAVGDLLAQSVAEPDGEIAAALATLSARAADQTVAALLDEALAERAALRASISSNADLARVRREVEDAYLGELGDTSERAERALFEEASIPPAEWADLAARVAAAATGKEDRTAADRLARAARAQGAARDIWLSIFLTGRGELRKQVVNMPVRTACPDIAARLEAERTRIGEVLDRIARARVVEGTNAILTLGHALIARIEREKAARGALDFDDLVEKTRDLFSRADARWILYKLDQGVDHILVDEAQDTSPAQWELIRALADEFASGDGARPGNRTIFAVGDEKQSIYSFQDADPKWFADMRRHFAGRWRDAGKPFQEVRLGFSFRSAQAVLGAVDKTFADQANRRGLSDDGVAPVHQAIRANAPGEVDIWPLTPTPEKTERRPFRAPLDALLATDPVVVLADRIAAHVARWIAERRVLPGRDRPIGPGDVMVLVRRRNRLFEAVIRALKTRGVPVAGADRMTLTDHIAVMDLMALGDALATPDDDLSLAAALKSPLFGLDDNDLLRFAPGRPASLERALAEGHPELHRRLLAWRAEASRMGPGDFYAAVLARDGMRARFLARLGPEADDALDEFLAAALAYESSEPPTLRGFLQSLRAAEVQVKRDMDLARDEVRVMTVHGAKGLEAGVVFLADTMSPPGGRHDPKLFAVTPPNSPHGTTRLLWSPSGGADIAETAEARLAHRDLQEQEYRRLLYVAMTRAMDKLVVCGLQPVKEPRSATPWYRMIESTIGAEAVEVPAEDGDGVVRVWPPGRADATKAPAPAAISAEGSEVPAWARRRAPRPERAKPTLAPSRLGLVPDAPPEPEEPREADRQAAMRRGVLVHRILQSLPDVATGERDKAMRRFLARQGDMDAAFVEGIVSSVNALLANPAATALLDPSGRAEVAVVGDIAGYPVSGQIDRLVVAGDTALVIDFKTNRPAPETIDRVPASYLTQLAVYRALVGEALPGKCVEAVIVWTDTPAVMPLPAALLDEALERLKAGPPAPSPASGEIRP